MHDLTSTAGIVALAAATVSLGAVLGDGRQDLVEHAVSLQAQFAALSGYVQATSDRLDERVEAAERRMDGAIAYRALVRYDAYGEMSGLQSASLALLDAARSGVVLSSINHRDQARLYAKQIHRGQAELELSPEESEAIRMALEGGGTPPA